MNKKKTGTAVSVPSETDVNGQVEALLGRMSIEEKVAQLAQISGASWNIGSNSEDIIRMWGAGSVLWLNDTKRFNELQKIAVEESPSKIPLLFALDVIHGYRTIFPVPLAMASHENHDRQPEAMQAGSGGRHQASITTARLNHSRSNARMRRVALTVARFPEPTDIGPREWGWEEELVTAPGKYTMKRIRMKKDAKGGLQYHRLKDEAGVMIWGRMLIRYDDGTGNLVEREVKTGDVFHFPAGCVHQAEALSICEYIECSTPHFNDRVHVEKEYGIAEEAGGLPSTTLEEVELR